ncbi:hypothetical protein EGW08_023078 [Elysia chlorotica]|uniref:C-type lectin domain-containing protein n=1 Tax=Elysia chlorotica TaxID=188477 RepID=A0A3S1AQI0_ELYCH|nr:hypothetical protein EGW08_023078 [Elysia chlorotica]
MSVQMSLVSTLLLVAAGTTLSLAVKAAGSSGITLDVTYNSKPDAQAGFLVINCSLAQPSLAQLASVASLAVFGSKPYGGKEENQLAVIDMWSNVPTLADELEESGVSVIGEIGPGRSSFLLLSWNSPIKLYRDSYTCVANGIDRDGQPKTSSTVSKIEVVSDGCYHKIQSLESKFDTQSLQLAGSLKTGSEIIQMVQSLDQRVEGIEEKLDAILFNSKVHSTLLAIDRTKFDISDLYNDTFYLASKEEAVFNLKNANSVCQASGGYLLEIDDDGENQFTFSFAKKIGGSDHFALGGNDVEQEGRFVYFNSKKPVPAHVTWMDARPNNAGGKEHCMEIWLSQGGLNDIPCDTKTKFVCEVPLRF